MFIPLIVALFVVKAEACSKPTMLFSLICAVKDVLSYFFHSDVIHLLSLELLPSISVIDRFQQSSSDWS